MKNLFELIKRKRYYDVAINLLAVIIGIIIIAFGIYMMFKSHEMLIENIQIIWILVVLGGIILLYLGLIRFPSTNGYCVNKEDYTVEDIDNYRIQIRYKNYRFIANKNEIKLENFLKRDEDNKKVSRKEAEKIYNGFIINFKNEMENIPENAIVIDKKNIKDIKDIKEITGIEKEKYINQSTSINTSFFIKLFLITIILIIAFFFVKNNYISEIMEVFLIISIVLFGGLSLLAIVFVPNTLSRKKRLESSNIYVVLDCYIFRKLRTEYSGDKGSSYSYFVKVKTSKDEYIDELIEVSKDKYLNDKETYNLLVVKYNDKVKFEIVNKDYFLKLKENSI